MPGVSSSCFTLHTGAVRITRVARCVLFMLHSSYRRCAGNMSCQVCPCMLHSSYRCCAGNMSCQVCPCMLHSSYRRCADNMSCQVCPCMLHSSYRRCADNMSCQVCPCMLHSSYRHHLVGLVVKASASRAEDPGFESHLRRDFFGVESCQ